MLISMICIFLKIFIWYFIKDDMGIEPRQGMLRTVGETLRLIINDLVVAVPFDNIVTPKL